MVPLKNPNKWSCLPTAFAIALDVSVESVIKFIGHDGSKITHAGLPEPMCRRGFHPQELIKMCLKQNRSVTRVELYPQAVSSSGVPHSLKLFNTGGVSWFIENLFDSIGVVDCRTAAGLGHAMAYQGMGNYVLIYDPATGKDFEFRSLEDTEQRDRFLVALWRIDTR